MTDYAYYLLRGLAIGGVLILGAIDLLAIVALCTSHRECSYAVAQYEELDRITDRIASIATGGSLEEAETLLSIGREVAHDARRAAAVCLGRPVETDDEDGVEL